MTILFEELKVLQAAEKIGDDFWEQIMTWDIFARDTVGKQLTRAADSIGANIAEAYGRFHYSEKLQFLYYARGSLFETKYWLNRARVRQLLPANQATTVAEALSNLAFQLNTFSKAIKEQRGKASQSPKNNIRESQEAYYSMDSSYGTFATDENLELFNSDEIKSLTLFTDRSPNNET